MSDFLIQVVEKDSGKVVHSWNPGQEAEFNFTEELHKRIRAKGVGVFRTENHVIEDVKAALKELLWDLKSKV